MVELLRRGGATAEYVPFPMLAERIKSYWNDRKSLDTAPFANYDVGQLTLGHAPGFTLSPAIADGWHLTSRTHSESFCICTATKSWPKQMRLRPLDSYLQ